MKTVEVNVLDKNFSLNFIINFKFVSPHVNLVSFTYIFPKMPKVKIYIVTLAMWTLFVLCCSADTNDNMGNDESLVMDQIIQRILDQKKFGPWSGKRSAGLDCIRSRTRRDVNIIDQFKIVLEKSEDVKQSQNHKLVPGLLKSLLYNDNTDVYSDDSERQNVLRRRTRRDDISR